MKKLLLIFLITLFSGGYLMSQSLSLSWDGVEIPHGDTVYVYGELDDENIFYEVVSHAVVTNNSDRNISLKAKRVEIETVPGSTNMLCWGVCFAPDIDISPDAITLEAGETTEEWVFAGHYQPNSQIGTSIIAYTFFNVDDEEDHVTMNVFYVVSPASLDDLQAKTKFSNAYPNPARHQVSFDYDFPAEIRTASIRVSNMLGKQMIDFQLNPNMRNVTIPLHDLGEGLYFYSLIINGETTSTRKLVIQR